MFVKVTADGGLTLEEHDNFRTFKVVIAGGRHDIERFRRALTGTIELADSDTAWVFEDTLRRQPEVAADTEWQQSLSAMMEKARPHGWIDDRRLAIKAHIEWSG